MAQRTRSDEELQAAEAATRRKLREAGSVRTAQLRRTLAAGGYVVSITAAGALLLEDAAGAPVALLRIVG